MTRLRNAGDVSQLPQVPFGPAALTWWGMIGKILAA